MGSAGRAGERRWAEFDAVVRLAGAAGHDAVGEVLCEVIESRDRPPHPERIVAVLEELGHDDAGHLLESLAGQLLYADGDAAGARRCRSPVCAIPGRPS